MNPLAKERLHASRAFTLVEVVLAMGILALLATAVYAVTSSAIGASRAAMEQQLVLRRADAFITVVRDALLNLPTLLRLPPGLREDQREKALSARGVPLLPGAISPQWTFFSGGTWREEWPAGSPRPQLIRLKVQLREIPDPIETLFYLPPLGAAQGATPQPTPSS